MTAKISQQVVPRRKKAVGVTRAQSSGVSQRVRGNIMQRGSINSSAFSLALGCIALVSVALLGFFYLQQVVNTASEGTDIHELESTIVGLKEKQKELELQGAQLRSLQAVEESVDKLNLVQTNKVSYLAVPDGHVAVAN